MRAKYQILIILFRRKEEQIEFCIFKRNDMNTWQGVAGGGEEGETIIESAKRELYEETGIKDVEVIKLDSISIVPSYYFKDSASFGKDFYVVPEYAFAVELSNEEIVLSDEHKEYKWCKYDEVKELLQWDSNKTALWEINERIARDAI